MNTDKKAHKNPHKILCPSLLALPTSSSSSAFLLCTLQSHSTTRVVVTYKRKNDTSGRAFRLCSQWVETWAPVLPRKGSDGCSVTLDLRHKGWVRAAHPLSLPAGQTDTLQPDPALPFLPVTFGKVSVYLCVCTGWGKARLAWALLQIKPTRIRLSQDSLAELLGWRHPASQGCPKPTSTGDRRQLLGLTQLTSTRACHPSFI